MTASELLSVQERSDVVGPVRDRDCCTLITYTFL